MTKKELMIKAHQMTKEIKVQYPATDYKFQLGLCLTYLHENKGENEMKVEEKLTGLGLKVWEKKDSEGNTTAKRIYINDVASLCENYGILTNVKRINKTVKMHYDCLTDEFSFSTSSSYKSTVNELIEAIRA